MENKCVVLLANTRAGYWDPGTGCGPVKCLMLLYIDTLWAHLMYLKALNWKLFWVQLQTPNTIDTGALARGACLWTRSNDRAVPQSAQCSFFVPSAKKCPNSAKNCGYAHVFVTTSITGYFACVYKKHYYWTSWDTVSRCWKWYPTISTYSKID